MKWLLFSLIFLSAQTYADEWKTSDKALLGAAVGLLVVDWGQTRNMVRHPYYIRNCQTCTDPYYEHNPLLGKDPTIGQVDKYFAAAILGTIGVAYVLPSDYRRYFLGGVVILETYWVLHNHHIGLRVEF